MNSEQFPETGPHDCCAGHRQNFVQRPVDPFMGDRWDGCVRCFSSFFATGLGVWDATTEDWLAASLTGGPKHHEIFQGIGWGRFYMQTILDGAISEKRNFKVNHLSCFFDYG
jgi:hypothetical protein